MMPKLPAPVVARAASRAALAVAVLSLFACASDADAPAPTVDAGATLDAGPPSDCRLSTPALQTMSEPCCAAWGRDACGALLYCAAIDGRTLPSCAPEGSQGPLERCSEDVACASGTCSSTTSLCLGELGDPCTVETGCAPARGGARVGCDPRATPPACAPVGDGFTTSVCIEDADCLSHKCEGGLCRRAVPGPYGEPCVDGADCTSGACVEARCTAAAGESCSDASDCGPGRACGRCSTCASTGLVCVDACATLECDEPTPAHASCVRTTSWDICPDLSAQPSCRVVARAPDDSSLTIGVSWLRVGFGGWSITCAPVPTFDTTVVRRGGGGGDEEVVIRPFVRGATYTCTLELLDRVLSSQRPERWLIGPSTSCSVVAP